MDRSGVSKRRVCSFSNLVFKGELGTDTVLAATDCWVRELLSVDSSAEGGLNTWAKSLGVGETKDTSAGNLGLDKSGLVKVAA